MSAIKRLGIDAAKLQQRNYTETQEQTRQTFGFKWAQRHATESAAVQEMARNWLVERYLDGKPERLAAWLKGDRKIILDAGCGSGWSAIPFFGEHLKEHDYLGVDISDAAWVAKERFAELGYPGEFLQCSITELPIPDASVDMVFSEGVLHHTDNTEESVKLLSQKVKPNGKFLFYVYARKGPIREFTDDFIRRKIADMNDEEAWKTLKPLTALGIELGKLNIEVDVPEDIPLLEIPKGRINLQRFMYWHVFKAFFREDLSVEEMHAINFDWYRPANCHRHTPDEVKRYCAGAGLEIEHMNVQEAGITVVARKL
jgi:arsenite methyltransferase